MINSSGVLHISISDHSLIYCVRKFPSFKSLNKGKTIKYRCFKKFNINLFLADLQRVPWNNILNFDDPNDMWITWKTLFFTVYDIHAPTKTKRVKSTCAPWLNKNLKELMFKRDALKRKAIITSLPNDWKNYKETKNRVNVSIKSAKSAYFDDKFLSCKGDMKKTWKTLNNLLSRKPNRSTSIKNLKTSHNSEINDPSQIANYINNYFANIGEELGNSTTDTDISFEKYITSSNTAFTLEDTCSSEVLNMLNSLVTCKATGLDGISTKILKMSAPIISPWLTVIFNQSFRSGIFPNEWKLAKVSPLFKNKKGNKRNNTEHYRPISILPIVAKISERIVYNQLYNYLTKNNLLLKNQSGFRTNHSTVTSLLHATNVFYTNADNGMITGVIFIDLKKAFDSVNHEILLRKLARYGLRGLTLEWFKSYLSNRHQKSYVNMKLSDEALIRCGVPQGSILGPLLFLIFINDFPNCLVNSKADLYADDTQVYAASQDIFDLELKLNEDLREIDVWLRANKLQVNITKTEYMLIGTDQKLNNISHEPVLMLDHNILRRVSNSKILGLIYDEHLRWNDHVNELIEKISQALKMIRRVSSFMSLENLLLIYHSLIEQRLNYCSVVWDTLSDGLSQKLQKLQNRAARIITKSSYDFPSEELLIQLKWRELAQERSFKKAIMMFKVLNNIAPEYLKDLFLRTNQVHDYGLRNSDLNLLPPKPKTNLLKKSFSYSGAVLWNSLPRNVRLAKSLPEFKRLLKLNGEILQ